MLISFWKAILTPDIIMFNIYPLKEEFWIFNKENTELKYLLEGVKHICKIVRFMRRFQDKRQ